jgi:predicted regulator of Ras-like GTPase activity (Roadblock/LC7/MglB family)
MSFASLLREIVEGCGGGIAAALMQSDGIPIDQVTQAALPGSPGDDVTTAGAEFGRILEEIRKASDAIAGGAVIEASVVMARLTLLFRVVDEDTFLVVALAPDGNLGKARYLMRKQVPSLRQLL